MNFTSKHSKSYTLTNGIFDEEAPWMQEMQDKLRLHSAVLVGGFVYVYGGGFIKRNNEEVQNFKLFVLDIQTSKWDWIKIRGSQPYPRKGHAAVLVQDKMIIHGGTNSYAGYYPPVDDTYVYDFAIAEWSKPLTSGDIQSRVDYHTLTFLPRHDSLLSFGGKSERWIFNHIYILALDTMRWSRAESKGERPSQRHSHTACRIGDRVYVYGGTFDALDTFYDLYVLNARYLSQLHWTAIVTGPRIIGATLDAHNGRLILYGGKPSLNNPVRSTACHSYSFRTRKWVKVKTSGHIPTAEHRSCLFGSKLIIIGGTGRHCQLMSYGTVHLDRIK